jgi:hypothetical protein
MWARFTVLNETPIASAIAGCVIPLSRGNTIWMRSRCAAGIFHRSAVFSSRICFLVHLTIRPPESDSQSESYPAPSRDPEKRQKSLDSNSYGSGIILFVTFGVIVVTLVGQGLLLPSVVRWLGLASHAADEHERERKAELAARSEALKVAQRRLQELEVDREISPDVLAILRARHDYRAVRLPDPTSNELEAGLAAIDLRSELITAEREYIYGLLRDGQITDEARRRIERELDLEEAGILELPL